MEDLSNWLTIKEMAEATGKSTRSIERLITLHRIQIAKRPKAGMKPETVIAPDEVEKHKFLYRPTVGPRADIAPTSQPDMLPAKMPQRQPDMRALLKALEQLCIPLSQKVYLTDKEAAFFLGFPQSEIKRLLDADSIPSIRLSNGWRRVARKDLENYKPPLVGVTEWRNGEHETRQ